MDGWLGCCADVVADLEELLPREEGKVYCAGAHFPEGSNGSTPCGCAAGECQSGWPDQEYYTPHRGKARDGHWSGKPSPKPVHAHGRKREV